MALPATAVWECRTTATAGNVNGGGFNSARGGTDYTLQDAAQVTNTDGASTASTNFASAGSTFTSVMVGNYIHITAGTGATTGWYEITAFVDANNVTLDRASGTYTGATFYLGGAMSLNSTLDDAMFEAMIAGNICYLKNGSFSLGQTVSIGTAIGSVSLFIRIVGYNTTRGDAPTGSTRPSINTGANDTTLNNYFTIENLIITTTSASGVKTGFSCHLINSKFINTSTTASRIAIYDFSARGIVLNKVEVISYRGIGVSFAGYNIILNSYIHDSNVGVSMAGLGGYVIDSIISDNVTKAINTTTTIDRYQVLVSGCTLYGAENKLGTGLSIWSSAPGTVVINNIFYGFATGQERTTASETTYYDDYNDYFNNTTDVSNVTKGANDIAVNPSFTSVAQLTGSTATTSGSVLTQSGGDFSTVTDNVDFVYIKSGTGVTVGKYLITAHTATTITLDIAPGTNATADKVWQITTGHNFLPTGSI